MTITIYPQAIRDHMLHWSRTTQRQREISRGFDAFMGWVIDSLREQGYEVDTERCPVEHPEQRFWDHVRATFDAPEEAEAYDELADFGRWEEEVRNG